MNLKTFLRGSIYTLLCFTSISLFAQNRVSGVLTDEGTGEGLIGANVIVQGTTDGTVTEFDGSFNLETSQALPFDLEISYTGYTTQIVNITQNGQVVTLALLEGIMIGEEVIVSASRRREKVQEAPASVSVLTERKLSAVPTSASPARSIINEPGVHVQQQGAGRFNVQLRGDGGIFGSATFPILDYRSLSGPGLGTYDVLNSPVNGLDLERVEVVRGAGSALYGPGVTAGVIHFISKSAIDRPGTSVEVFGGSRSTYGVSARHATKISDKFGFKVTGFYKTGDEFTYDINNPIDAEQIALVNTGVANGIQSPAITNGVVDATKQGPILLPASSFDPNNPVQDYWESWAATANLEFRPTDDLSINLAGGLNSGSAPFYNSQGVGLTNSIEEWAQVRMQKGGLFAQAFWLHTAGQRNDDGKPTFLYQTGNSTAIDRSQYEAQIQYNFDTPKFLNAQWTTGVDYRLSVADTGNEVYGRFEDDDNFGIFGGYVQGKFELSSKLDFVAAGRVDGFDFIDETAFSPRAVLVYKPSPTHTLRFGFNRAVGAPTQLQVNIDFPVSSPVPGAFDIWLVGNKEEQTFPANPMIVWNGVFGGAIPNLPVGTPGFPNAVTYGAVATPTLNLLIPGIEAFLQTPAGGGLPQANASALATAIQTYLQDPANTPGGFTGSFFGFNIFNGQPLGLLNAPAASLRTEDTWELGYKGLVKNKLGISIDIYNRKVDGATLFTGISPTYALVNPQYGADLGAAVNDADLQTFLMGLTNNAALTAGLAATIQDAFVAGGNGFATSAAGGATIGFLSSNGILATTPTANVPSNGVTHLAAGYRTFEAYDYWGVDAGFEYYFSQKFSAFLNYSFVSQNEFNPRVIGTDGTARTAISQPLNRWRLGMTYAGETGWRGSWSLRHDDEFQVFLGQYSGLTDIKNIVDASIGYRFDNGLALDLSATNLFEDEYRAYPGFPSIGRMVLGKVTYSFGENP